MEGEGIEKELRRKREGIEKENRRKREGKEKENRRNGVLIPWPVVEKAFS